MKKKINRLLFTEVENNREGKRVKIRWVDRVTDDLA